MAQISVLGNPNEYTAYGLITETFILHKQPHNHYTIFPQFFIPWNPQKNDSRGNIPDFVLGLYSDSPPHVHIQGGVEIKKATPWMIQLPPTNVISEDRDIQNIFRSFKFQAEDQAKAAVKGNHLPNEQLLWLMFIGPYFTILELGPFNDCQLITRGHNPNASGDFYESLVVEAEKKLEPIKREVYLLGTAEAAERLEFFINTTSRFLTYLT